MQPTPTNGESRPDYTSMILSQTIHVLPSLELECGATLEQVPIAYKTWGTLNETRDNVMVICHAFTGSADVEDWWGPLMGPGKAFDPSRFFIFCGNVMGSPYGSASPVTVNPATGQPYGPEFPLTTIRDDVRAHKLVLDHLGVRSIAVVVGGSMGGMAVLEWPLCTPPSYVRHIIPLATSARHSAWCISWSETQRQSIYSDPLFNSGYYSPSDPPKNGLAAARMAALLTYRSRDSFEGRFGRKPQLYMGPKKDSASAKPALITPPRSPNKSSLEALAAHNEGNRNTTDLPVIQTTTNGITGLVTNGDDKRPAPGHGGATTVFSAQSYLRYQGDKFTSRFDANCYIHITRKMDTHDVARGRGRSSNAIHDNWRGIYAHEGSNEALAEVLSTLPRGALVIGVESDGLFTPSEQRELAAHIPDAELVMIQSIDGHDGFLLEFQEINRHVLGFLHRVLPELYVGEAKVTESKKEDFEVTRTSTFGEAEVDVAMW
ncbi:Homoserine O-acetyltransferase; AltName: Full=Homoserine O-trans-acetylase [Serendipita indica DSM 11827]|nr:Homoserine O-acetyltransferase; AltName: Full=Homoserine O-trans-acetylase [Serendipita indica DSM 11827]